MSFFVTTVVFCSSASLVPIYDLTDGHFDPTHDFLDAETTRTEISGIEVPTTEITLVTFYVIKWFDKTGEPKLNIDFNLQWIGLLSKM